MKLLQKRTGLPIFASLVIWLNTGLCVSLQAQTPDEALRIQEAQSALEEAKSALEEAQSTLNQAQRKKQLKKVPLRAEVAQNGKLYKWVDDKGKISYQDSPPPKNSKVIDSDVLKNQQQSAQPVKELRRASDPAPILDGSVPVMVYTADNCLPCQSVVLFLTQKQVPFIERDIRSDRRARDRLSRLSKQITVPSLFIGGEIVQGHAKPPITRALKKAGYLKP